MRSIVVPRAAAKADEASRLVKAAGTSSRLLSKKQLGVINESTGYMTQEEATEHVEQVLARHSPKECESRAERAREADQNWAAQLLAKRATEPAAPPPPPVHELPSWVRQRWVRFLRTSPHSEIGEPVEIVGLSKSGKALRTAHGGACPLVDEGRVWEYCEPPVCSATLARSPSARGRTSGLLPTAEPERERLMPRSSGSLVCTASPRELSQCANAAQRAGDVIFELAERDARGASRDLPDIDKAQLVVAALRGLALHAVPGVHAAWGSVVDSATEVAVEDLSASTDGVCGGQGNAFKVSLLKDDRYSVQSAGQPAAVVLHRLREGDRHDMFSARCRKAAAEAFSEHQLGPRLLMPEVGDWWIESFDGVRCGPWKTTDELKDIGLLLARAHTIPTDWFDEYRAEIVSRWPRMREAAPESHAWVCVPWVLWELDCFSPSLTEAELVAEMSAAGGGDAEDIAFLRAIRAFEDDPTFFHEWADLGALKPRHPAAKRLVTLHGDFHPGNVLVGTHGPPHHGDESVGAHGSLEREDSPYLCIDFEQACVSSAIYDLAYVVNSEIPVFVEGGPAKQAAMARVFLAAYLNGIGQPHSTEAELDMLVADCMLAGFFLKEVGLLHWDCLVRSRQETFVPREDPRAHLRQCKAWGEVLRAGGAAMYAEVASGGGLTWQGQVWPCRRME